MLIPMEGYKTLKQLAAMWKRSQPTLRQQIASGVLKAEKFGDIWAVTDEDARHYEENHLNKRGTASPLHPGTGGRKPHPTPPATDHEGVT